VKARGDLAVIGEGEEVLEELLDIGLEHGRLPNVEELGPLLGVAYLEGEAVRFNGLRPTMGREAYDGLTPSTGAVRDYPLHFAARVYVEVLRGCSNYTRAGLTLPEGACSGCGRCRSGGLEERYDCPFGVPPGCGYCSGPSLYGPPRSRSTGKICREVRELLAEGVRRIVLSAPDFLDYGRDLLVDPEPLTDPRHPEPNYGALEDLLSSLAALTEISEGDASLMIENVKGCLVTERAARLLGSYLPGTPVNIGLETGSEGHCLQLGRPSTPEENLRAVRRLKRSGLKPYVYFIHGLPGQSSETVDKTVDAIAESVGAGASRIILYRFQPLPMSAFSGQPSAPPASKDGLSNRIYKAALEANRSLKEELLGRRLRVVVAEPYDRDRRFHVAYPLKHGPVVLVEGAEGREEEEVLDIVVTGVVSDRMVRGRLVGVRF
ncbi:MAG: radical SAM protein, partial [Candidatus Bathyarchaeia archaeon]